MGNHIKRRIIIKEDINKKRKIINDGDVLQQQKNEMEELEKQAQMKEEQMKKEKLREQKEKLEEEKKLKNIENKAKEAKQKIVDEPEEGNPDVTTICFRYPDGEKRKDRRFLKSHTIQNLYDFITSLGNEIYSEEGNTNFSLYQPFPPKKYDNMENTFLFFNFCSTSSLAILISSIFLDVSVISSFILFIFDKYVFSNVLRSFIFISSSCSRFSTFFIQFFMKLYLSIWVKSLKLLSFSLEFISIFEFIKDELFE